MKNMTIAKKLGLGVIQMERLRSIDSSDSNRILTVALRLVVAAKAGLGIKLDVEIPGRAVKLHIQGLNQAD